LIIWLIFLSFPSVCLVPAGHFCYFGFSLCGVWRLSTELLLDFKVAKLSWPRMLKLLNFGVTNLSVYPICLCLYSFCFWGKYANSWIWNDISRYCLLGHRKKIVKFFMRTFTCRSTFLYDTCIRKFTYSHREVRRGER
jgi:hypothetical protein